MCGRAWFYGRWDYFVQRVEPSIEYLELFAVTVAVLNWLKYFKNKRIFLHCDNQSVVYMINNMSSSCRNCMVLIHIIVIEALMANTRVFAKHVKSSDNVPSDALSRLQIDRFKLLTRNKNMFATPDAIPVEVWPIEKIWMK